MIEQKLLLACRQRQAVLEKAVFSSPPKTLEDFKERLGRWLELNETAQWLSEAIEKLDKEED